MRKKTIIVTAVAGLALTALAVPAASAKESTLPARSLPATGCARPATNPGRPAKADDIVVCVTRKPAARTGKKLQAVRGNAIGVSSLLDSCMQTELPVWLHTRTEACVVGYAVAYRVSRFTGGILGWIDLQFIGRSFTSLDANTWSLDVEMTVLDTMGAVAGSTVSLQLHCGDSCTGSVDLLPQPFAFRGTKAFGHATLTSLIALPYSVETATMFASFVITGPRALPSDTVVTPVETVRCDSATPGRFDIGCIFQNAEPAVFPAALSRAYPAFARHVHDAQNSGLPGSPQSFRPLHRLTDESEIDKNGRTACPASWERPEFLQCDEYPFRSTYEGARFQRLAGFHGRTFSWCGIPQLPQESGENGWSSCFIWFRDNLGAGATLGSWYRQNRILAQEPFYVETP
jgi:hypothetical protein